MSILTQIYGASRRWLVGIIFVGSALLLGVTLSACDSGTSSATTPGPQVSGTPRTGMAIYAQYCNTCHPGGDAGEGPSLKNTMFGPDQIKQRVRNGFRVMPAFTTMQISDAELDALVTYVQSLHN